MSVNEQNIAVLLWFIYSLIRNIKTPNRFVLFDNKNVHDFPLCYIRFHAILLQCGMK